MGEEEPLVDYHLFASPVLDGSTFETQKVSCLVFSEETFCMATRGGTLFVLNAKGEELRRFHDHSSCITDLSLDSDGSFVGSCGVDGRVVLHSLRTLGDPPWSTTIGKALWALALHPAYGKSLQTKMLCVGGDDYELVLNKRGLLASSNTVLHSGEGTVLSVRWRGTLIAWINLKGLKIYDMSTQQKVTYIPKSTYRPEGSDVAIATEMTPALCWMDDETILFAWGFVVKIAKIRQTPGDMSVPAIRYAEVVEHFALPRLICAASPFEFLSSSKERLLAVLTSAENGTVDDVDGLQHHICKESGDVVLSDLVPLPKGCYDGTDRANGFRLEHAGLNLPNYIVAPHHLIMARRRSIADHSMWLVERERYEEAIEVAKQGPPELLRLVTQSCVCPLLTRKEYDRAAAVLKALQMSDAEEWKTAIDLFTKHKALCALLPYIPLSKAGGALQEQPCIPLGSPTNSAESKILVSLPLPTKQYEAVLCSVAEQHPVRLVHLIRSWPVHLFDLQNLIAVVEKFLSETEKQIDANTTCDAGKTPKSSIGELVQRYERSIAGNYEASIEDNHGRRRAYLEAVAYLYESTHAVLPFLLIDNKIKQTTLFSFSQYSKALSCYMRLESCYAFSFLHSQLHKNRELQDAVIQNAVQLIQFDKTQAFALLCSDQFLKRTDEIVTAIGTYEDFLYLYFRTLLLKDASLMKSYGKTHLDLCMKHDPSRLMEFLKLAEGSYDPQEALCLCQHKRENGDSNSAMLYAESFLLGKSRRVQEGLDLLLTELQDVRAGVRYATDYPEMWESLVAFALSRPAALSELLTYMEPEIATSPRYSSHTADHHSESSTFITPLQVLKRLPDGELSAIPCIASKLFRIFEELEAQEALQQCSLSLFQLESSHFSHLSLTKRRRAVALVLPQTPCTQKASRRRKLPQAACGSARKSSITSNEEEIRKAESLSHWTIRGFSRRPLTRCCLCDRSIVDAPPKKKQFSSSVQCIQPTHSSFSEDEKQQSDSSETAMGLESKLKIQIRKLKQLSRWSSTSQFRHFGITHATFLCGHAVHWACLFHSTFPTTSSGSPNKDNMMRRVPLQEQIALIEQIQRVVANGCELCSRFPTAPSTFIMREITGASSNSKAPTIFD